MAKIRVSDRLRRTISKQAHGCCEYCKCPEAYSPQTFSVEHIVPLSQGGTHNPENLAFSCQGCNVLKSAKTQFTDTITGDVVSLFNPRTQSWSDHFAWDDSWQYIIGITPIGRATATLLQLNRPYVINLRNLLILVGEHPPIEG